MLDHTYTVRDVHVGDVVVVREWGSITDTETSGVVTAVHADVKNGRAGIDYLAGAVLKIDRWAYLSQVVFVSPAADTAVVVAS